MKSLIKVGFLDSDIETSPGVWKPTFTEKSYKADILKDNRRFQNSDNQNDDITISIKINILSDKYFYSNLHMIRYVILDNVKWKVVNFDPSNRPKVTLELGGIYNEQTKTIAFT